MRLLIYFLLVLILSLFGCQKNELLTRATNENDEVNVERKPDLIIDEITYERLPNCYQDYPSGIICGGPRFEFTLRIKNIGKIDVTSPLFITNSRSKWDFDNQYCSYSQRVNDPPLNIPKDGTLDIKLESNIADSVQNVLFVLDTYDRTNSSLNLPKIDELNYENNSSIVTLNW